MNKWLLVIIILVLGSAMGMIISNAINYSLEFINNEYSSLLLSSVPWLFYLCVGMVILIIIFGGYDER